jgi:hypothetical protein
MKGRLATLAGGMTVLMALGGLRVAVRRCIERQIALKRPRSIQLPARRIQGSALTDLAGRKVIEGATRANAFD